MRKPDFEGWATKNDVKCADGRIIRQNAFQDDDGKRVPLIYNHNHTDPEMIIGHAILENREDGVYSYNYLNHSAKADAIREALSNGDVNALSIYANKLVQKGSDVLHGVIRELSVVLAGANPEAFIENAMLAHGDIFEENVMVEITSGDILCHSAKDKDPDEEDDDEEDKDVDDENDEDSDEEPDSDEEADEEDEEDKKMKHSDEGGKTVGDVLKTLNEDQKKAVAILIDAVGGKKGDDKDDEDDNEEDDADMKHNVFEGDNDKNALSHDQLNNILADGKRFGSLKESYVQHAAEYGIDNIEWLFPEYKNINGNGAPEFIKRQPDDWVNVVLNGVHHTPFSRIKMMFADITGDDARARGYAQKGKLKREEVFGLLRRTVDPTTIYKKQKFDKDDLRDITDFDVIPWIKAEMRMMLDEEIARAILFGDGRSTLDPDKIDETHIIPICSEQALFRLEANITPESGESDEHAFIRTALQGQDDYEGSGNTILFMNNKDVTKLLLMEDGIGHRLYNNVTDLANAMSVGRIVKVPAAIIPTGVKGLIVDLRDYNIGADRGGAVNMFDDFDIDYNQEKYLIETRCSGALTRPFSAVVLKG